MKALLSTLVAVSLLSSPALASPDDDLRAELQLLRARVIALESARLSPAQPAPQPKARLSPAIVGASKALLAYRWSAFGSPLFGATITGGGFSGTVPANLTFSTANADVVVNTSLDFTDGTNTLATLTDGGSVAVFNLPNAGSSSTVSFGTGGALSELTGFTTAMRFRTNTGVFQFHDGSNTLLTVTDDGSTGYISGASTKQKGTISLSGGTGTATTFSGATCVCTDTTANASVKCAVSGTTLTATGTTTDVIAYRCD